MDAAALRMKDISGVVKVVERIDSDVKETNIWIDYRTKELKQLEGKVDNLVDCLVFLEQANIEKEGQIYYLEGVIQSMSDKLCWCGDREVSSVLVEAGTEEPMVEEAEGSQLEYAEDNEYHTPEVEEVPLPVCELRLIESPSSEQLANFFNGDECCRPCHPGIRWRSAGPSPAPSEDDSPVENVVPIPIQIQRSALVNCYVRIRPDPDVPRGRQKTESGGQLLTVLTRTRAGRANTRTEETGDGRSRAGGSERSKEPQTETREK